MERSPTLPLSTPETEQIQPSHLPDPPADAVRGSGDRCIPTGPDVVSGPAVGEV
jgi:hypothetical protein